MDPLRSDEMIHSLAAKICNRILLRRMKDEAAERSEAAEARPGPSTVRTFVQNPRFKDFIVIAQLQQN